LTRSSPGERLTGGWPTPERLTGTVTFLFTDIEGSTRLLRTVGRERYGALLARHQELLREAFAAHRGKEIDTQGDGFFVAFRSASDALEAAAAVQRSLAAEEWPDNARLHVRIGVHSGEASAAGDRYVGLSVHRAARVGAIGHGGQVLVSSATRELVEDDLPQGLSLRDLGSHRLKDVARPERISQLVGDGLRLKFPPLGTRRRRGRLLLAAPAALLVVAGAAALGLVLVGGHAGSPQAFAGVEADSVGVFRDGHSIADTSVGTGPHGVAAGDGAVWVTNTDADTVSRLDPKTNAVVQTINVGNGPEGIAVGAGSVWVANSLSGTITRIDTQTNDVVKTIPVGNQPTGVAFGLNGVWVTDAADRTLLRVDPKTGASGKPLTIEQGADAVAVGNGSVWVTSGGSPGNVTRVDPTIDAVVTTITVGNNPSAIASGPGAVWVANREDGTVSQINPASNRQASVITVGAGPSGVALSDGAVWIANELGGTISKINPASNEVSQTVETDNRPLGVAAVGAKLYVAVRTSGRAHRGGTLRILSPPIAKFMPDIDPADMYLTSGWQMLLMTNDGLTAYRRVGGGDGLQVVPDLATSLPQPTDGGRTYTFQLRRDIHYSTGRVVRPTDIRRGLERALAVPGGPGRVNFTDIVGAKACTSKRCDLARAIVANDDANTVTFHLTAPDPNFLAKLALPTASAVPADTPLRVQSRPLPATGPYMFASYDPKHSIRLIRNPRFREWSAAAQPDGNPDEIAWSVASKKADIEQVRAVERGDGDLAWGGVPASVLSDVQTRFPAQVHVSQAINTHYFDMNTRLPPFNDRRVRQALNYALDRNKLAAMQATRASPTCQVLPPGMFGYRRYCPYTRNPGPDGRYRGPDFARAKRLVEASRTKGEAITVWAYGDQRPLGPYVASMLRRLGYVVQFNSLAFGKQADRFFADLAKPHNKIQLVLNGGWGPDYPSPLNFFGVLFACDADPTQNEFRFCNRAIDAEIAHANALQVSDPKRAAALWNKVDRDVVDEAPIVPGWNERAVDFVSRRVGNYQYNPEFTALLDQLWVR
jgi:peptide/nickel transport system substrate-binding protein